jgi:hypothetical protein
MLQRWQGLALWLGTQLRQDCLRGSYARRERVAVTVDRIAQQPDQRDGLRFVEVKVHPRYVGIGAAPRYGATRVAVPSKSSRPSCRRSHVARSQAVAGDLGRIAANRIARPRSSWTRTRAGTPKKQPLLNPRRAPSSGSSHFSRGGALARKASGFVRLTGAFRALPPRPRQHEIDLPPTAPRAHEPLVPVEHGNVGAVTRSQLAGIGLDLTASLPCTRRSGARQHRRHRPRTLGGRIASSLAAQPYRQTFGRGRGSSSSN